MSEIHFQGEVHTLPGSWEEINRAWTYFLKERQRINEKGRRRRLKIKEMNKDQPAKPRGRPRKSPLPKKIDDPVVQI